MTVFILKFLERSIILLIASRISAEITVGSTSLFDSANLIKRSAVSPFKTGIDLIVVAIILIFFMVARIHIIF